MSLTSSSLSAPDSYHFSRRAPFGIISSNTPRVSLVDRDQLFTRQMIVCTPLTTNQERINDELYAIVMRQRHDSLLLMADFLKKTSQVTIGYPTETDMTECAQLAARVVALANRQLVDDARERIDELIQGNHWSGMMMQSFVEDKLLRMAVRSRVDAEMQKLDTAEFVENEELQRFFGDDLALLLSTSDNDSILYVRDVLNKLVKDQKLLPDIQDGFFGSYEALQWRLKQLLLQDAVGTLNETQQQQLGMIFGIFMSDQDEAVKAHGQALMKKVRVATPIIREAFAFVLNALK